MVGELMADFGVSSALLGNLSALYFYAYASLQIPIGVMVDRWGPRRLMTAAWLLAGAGSLLFAAAETLEAAYLGRFLIGVGSAFFFVCSLISLINSSERVFWASASIKSGRTSRKTSPLSPVSDSLREMAMGERNEGSTWVFRS